MALRGHYRDLRHVDPIDRNNRTFVPFRHGGSTIASAIAPLHTIRFPGETDEYRAARNELLQAELELRRQNEAVAAQRRRLPLGGEVPTDYAFHESVRDAARSVRLSELFANGQDTLVLYSFMFIGDGLESACPSCTSIIDAVDGETPHMVQRVSLAAVAKVPIERFRDHARTRGWRNIRLLSSADTTYNRDYHGEGPDESQDPIATVFVRRDGKVHHFYSTELLFAPTDPGVHPRHVDFMWPVWNVLDLTPAGRGTDWSPQLEYR
ncbi:MAG TPA: DUF899 family protein [Gaiellaceae bacterium]|jgi:predicted dithiol-disulfide oxidoreductase (DUF899 family)